jgi:integrase
VSSRVVNRRAVGTGSLIARRVRGGRFAWYARYVVAGQRVHRRLGFVKDAVGGLTRAQAERELHRRLAEAERLGEGASLRVTVAFAGADLLRQLAAIGRKPSTIGSYESMLRVHLVPWFGTHPMASLRRRDVEAFADAKLRDGLSAKSVRNLLGVLHAVYRHAQRREWVAANPVELAHRPRVSGSKDIRFLTLDEVDQLIAAIEGDDPYEQLDRVLILAAAHTGMRKGELAALRWKDIDWTAGRVRVRRAWVRRRMGTPKSRRGARSIPLSARLAHALQDHRDKSRFQAEDDLVFAHPLHGGPLAEATTTRRFKRHAAKAGVRTDVRFHDLRHTFGTAMAASGEVPLRTLQEWMGHRDAQTTQIHADYAESPHEARMLEQALSSDEGHREGHGSR